MDSIDEDKEIWDVFDRVIDLGAQLNENMWKGDKEPILGKKKKSNLLLVEDMIEYKNQLEREEEKLYHLLIKLNRIEIRESKNPNYVEKLKSLRQFYFALEDVWDDPKSKKEIIEYHIAEGLIDRDLFFENYYSLDSPYVGEGAIIPEHVNRLCQESRWCYVYEQYNATIVLSRSIIETILRDKLNYSIKEWISIKKLINKARDKKIIRENIAEKIHEIRKLANNILHRGEIVERKKTKRCLDSILDFLEEIYLNKA